MGKYRLEDLCSLITDGTHQTPTYCDAGGYIFLSSKDVTTRKIKWEGTKFIPEELHQKLYSRLKPQVNDILLAKNGTTGVAAIVDRDIVFDIYVSLALLRPKDIVLPKYLLYFINSPIAKRQFNKGLKGIGVPNLHLGTIRETEIKLPSIAEQEKISNIFDKLANIIENRQYQLEELDNLIKSRFVEMFGDIKNNQFNCQVRTIGDFTEVLTGATPLRDNPEYFGGTIPWVKTGEISKGKIVNAEEFITEKALKETNCKLLPIGTIMVAMYGQGKTRGQVGTLNIEATTNQACAAIIPNANYNSVFMFRQLELRYDDLREMGRGGNQPNLNLSMVRNFEVLFPNIKIQNNFADFATHVDKLKVEVQKSLNETQLLFDSLMQEYFE